IAGMERDWPEGRGIFLNKDKTFLIWVNEEDQLRIISMQKGGDVKAVFKRLVQGIRALGDSVEAECGKDFICDPRLGYIHSCPTNLGTGMRASVHVDLPGWTEAGMEKLKKRCEELKVQPRGTRGESGGDTGITYDISNKHRLGYTEVQLVQTMIDAVNTLHNEDIKWQRTLRKTQMSTIEPAPPFPTIQSKESLVAKYVTKELWNKLGGHRTATAGFTLTKAIACAVNFDNQHCGIYAGDWDSYNDFKEVFDPIIQKYHGIKPNSVHKSDLDVTKIKGNINEDVPVRSVRIRVGRSIDGFGLSPGITKDQRLGVENLMKHAFQKLSGDLSGTYYPLTGMDEKVRQQLVDDHFLFMSGDPNLKAAGMERDWPEGRGIYHNKEKTFLVWVNEEDQLRIISMEMGGDVRGVFERLVHGINAVGESVKCESGKDFAYDEKYGFIHSCPTNLGTGMRASVHLDLPGWTKDNPAALQKRCEELKIQPRGTRGESGGQTGCTYDISNKHRLGYSEVELVQCMIDGVNTLYKEDIELQKKNNIYPAMPEIASTHSLVAKYVTPAVWKKLANLKTATSGFSLYKAMACAVLFDNQHCGIYAGDWDSYKDFKDVFDPIIQEYHGIKPNAKHTSDMDVSKVNGNIDPAVPVHSVRIRVGRNIDSFGLSPGITKDQRLGVENLMKGAFKELTGDLSGTYYPLTGMNEKVRQQLVDDHFLFVSGDPNLKVAGMERNWPEGRGIFHNKDKTFLVWVNEEDQLRIISMDMNGDVRGVFERLAQGIEAVQASVGKLSGKKFMLDPKYGYIHACPTNLGTGMRASVHVDLPGWTKEGLDVLKKRCEELKVQPRGTRGESGGQTGCTFDISNKHRLGYSEVELVQCMIDGVNKLYLEDISLQKKQGIYPVMPEIKSTKSLVAKYLTPKLWTKLHDLKTSTSGFTLRQAIATSHYFSNQHCGIYAGDWDSYKVFAEVFDPIIQDYHGLSPKAVHTSDMDASKLQGNIDPSIPVQSARIRVGRNIAGFGLSPGITELQRLSVEYVMKSVFPRLRGEFNGHYYPLTNMSEDRRQKLVDDHFLFMSGDPNLKVAGMERDWPSGRGIFYNESKTFLVWVNEEDQLRIISMDIGGDIKTIFERLTSGIKSVGDALFKEYDKEFAYDPKYGYIHSCPTNLGTGMRASVHVDLPGWSKEGMEALLKRCEELKLQPRGTRGESGGQTGWTFDISNKHRLGYTEVQLVQCMIDGVNILYKEDIELQKAHKIFPVMPEIRAKNSQVAKHLTPEIWTKYSQHKTKTVGFSLRQAITCSLMFDDQKIGIYAGDPDCYKDYKEIFDPIIKEYHGINLFAAHCSCVDMSKLKGNIDPYAPVFSTRIRFSRNVDGFGFSPGITKQQRLQVEALAKKAFDNLRGELSGTYYPLLGMAENTREQLFQDGFLFKCGDSNLKNAGSERDWPEGRGIFHNSTKTFLVWLNEEDQLKIISMQKGGNIRSAFERLVQGEWSIIDSIKKDSNKSFARDFNFGFLNACPSNLGTAMAASVHIELPGFAKAGFPELQKRCTELGLKASKGRGKHDKTFDISNKFCMGFNDIELIQLIIDGVNTLYTEDVKLQKKLK
ncbi:unnamed protein product, partial [Meganyctiphanes norvegica]